MNRHEAALRLLLMVRPTKPHQQRLLPAWNDQWDETITQLTGPLQRDYQLLAALPAPVFGYHPAAVTGALILAAVTVIALYGYRETSAAALFCLTLTPLLSHLMYTPYRQAAARRGLSFIRGVVSVEETEEIEFSPPGTPNPQPE